MLVTSGIKEKVEQTEIIYTKDLCMQNVIESLLFSFIPLFSMN